jgi:hypothetical protein
LRRVEIADCWFASRQSASLVPIKRGKFWSFLLKDDRELFFALKGLRGKYVPDRIDIDRQHTGTVNAQNHLSDPHLMLVDLRRLVGRIDE